MPNNEDFSGGIQPVNLIATDVFPKSSALEPEPAVAGPRGVGVKGRGKFGGLDKVCRLLGTAVAYHGKPYAGGIEAVFYGGQSSSLLLAEQSTEVAYETQHHGTLGPERG